MSLIQIGPMTPPPPRAKEPIKPLEFKPIIKDNQVVPASTLKGYVEGMPIVVNYYKKLNDNNTATYGHDSGKSPLLQQFIKINGLKTRLDGDILPTQDPKDQTFSIKGEMFITSGVVPNEGDLFTYDAGDGRFAVFQLNTSNRMTAMNNTVYRTAFTLVFYTTDPRYQDLETKVVQELWFMEDHAQFGKDAVVTTEAYHLLRDIFQAQGNMTEDYIREFRNREKGFFAVPQQTFLTYDAFLAVFVRGLIDPRRHPSIDNVNFYAFTLDEFAEQPTIWDALHARRPDLLVNARTTSQFARVDTFPHMPMARSIRYCGAGSLVLPGSDNPSDALWKNATLDWLPDDIGAPPAGTDLVPEVPVEGLGGLMPEVHHVCKDGSYVFSKAFYTKDVAGFSLLEKLVWDYLDKKPINLHQLHALASNQRRWTRVRRFYYVPVIMMLIQMVIQDTSMASYGLNDQRVSNV